MHFKNTDIADKEETQKKALELMTCEAALLASFEGEIKRVFG